MKEQKPLTKAKQPIGNKCKELEQTNKRLEKELKRVKMERDILKKAAAYKAEAAQCFEMIFPLDSSSLYFSE